MSTLAKLALIQSGLRDYHNGMVDECPGAGNCPLLAIMGDIEDLMTDIATKKEAAEAILSQLTTLDQP